MTSVLVFALIHFIFQGQTCLLFWVSFDFLLLNSNPLCEKDKRRNLFLMLVIEGLAGLQRTGRLQLLWHQGAWDIDFCLL